MLLELEQECLDIYNKKVEKTRKHRAELQRSLAQSEAEIASLMSALGEQVSFSRVIMLVASSSFTSSLQVSLLMRVYVFE